MSRVLLPTCAQSELSHDVVQSVLREYRLHSCDVVVKEDVTIDQFIDVVEGNRKYMPALYVMNKIDQVRRYRYCFAVPCPLPF